MLRKEKEMGCGNQKSNESEAKVKKKSVENVQGVGIEPAIMCN